MAVLGLPGLAGFWGEFPAILSTYNPLEAADLSQPLFRTLMVIAAFGTVFAAGLPALALPAHGVRHARSATRSTGTATTTHRVRTTRT